MKHYIKAILATALMLSGLNALAAPRLPITCKFKDGEAKIYEQFMFSAFVNTQDKSIKYALIVSDPAGKTVLQSFTQQNYKTDKGIMAFNLVANDTQALSGMQISQKILTSAAQTEGQWNQRSLTCSILPIQLDNMELPANDFAKYNLEIENGAINPAIKIKAWTSSDSRFSFNATLYPDAPATAHYPHVPSHVDMAVSLAGSVIDDQQDSPESISYILYGNSEKIVQTRLSNKSDVLQMIKIFGAGKTVLHLTHPYGHTDPVQVEINCTSGSECILTARN